MSGDEYDLTECQKEMIQERVREELEGVDLHALQRACESLVSRAKTETRLEWYERYKDRVPIARELVEIYESIIDDFLRQKQTMTMTRLELSQAILAAVRIEQERQGITMYRMNSTYLVLFMGLLAVHRNPDKTNRFEEEYRNAYPIRERIQRELISFDLRSWSEISKLVDELEYESETPSDWYERYSDYIHTSREIVDFHQAWSKKIKDTENPQHLTDDDVRRFIVHIIHDVQEERGIEGDWTWLTWSALRNIQHLVWLADDQGIEANLTRHFGGCEQLDPELYWVEREQDNLVFDTASLRVFQLDKQEYSGVQWRAGVSPLEPGEYFYLFGKVDRKVSERASKDTERAEFCRVVGAIVERLRAAGEFENLIVVPDWDWLLRRYARYVESGLAPVSAAGQVLQDMEVEAKERKKETYPLKVRWTHEGTAHRTARKAAMTYFENEGYTVVNDWPFLLCSKGGKEGADEVLRVTMVGIAYEAPVLSEDYIAFETSEGETPVLFIYDRDEEIAYVVFDPLKNLDFKLEERGAIDFTNDIWEFTRETVYIVRGYEDYQVDWALT